MSMEYRGRITVPGLPFEAESEHERLFDRLIEQSSGFGPVMSWTDDRNSTVVILATDAEDQASAVEVMVRAVSSALHSANLGSLYPAEVEIEIVEDQLAPA